MVKIGRRSRSMLDRAVAIFELLEQHILDWGDTSIPKSKFQEVGISPKDTDQWLQLIDFIQSKPRVRTRKKGKRTYVSTAENNLMIYLRRKFMDTQVSYEERKNAIMMYLNLMVNLEKARGDEIDWGTLIDDPWKISRPTIIRLVEEADFPSGTEKREKD